MALTLLHTAQSHCATFDAVRDRIAPQAKLRHVVRETWLERAQNGIGPSLAAKIRNEVTRASGEVICTCTTLGPVAASAGATRVDWAMMQEAARLGGDILMVYCLESTWQPSLELLDLALAENDTPAKVHPFMLNQYWPLFEAGEHQAFLAVIAEEIRQIVPQFPNLGSVILAQVSMAGAAPLLAGIDLPVLASPELALRAALKLGAK